MKFEYFSDSLAKVRCDEGFEFCCNERFEVMYRETEHELRLYCEFGRKPSGRTVFMIGIGKMDRWDPPFEQEPISPDKRSQILVRITAAVQFMDCDCDFYSP